MRWDNLLADQEETETAVLPLFAGEAVVRRFKTPQFRGMTFYEVAAKSIINHVPGDRYGFNWTINPYRGCSHACSYCVSGDTPVLMATGRTKPLADIRPGDGIYGTVRTGAYRRYVKTVVSDHWSTVKPAYRVALEDGTELVTSGDHRFLTARGWKHVTGAQHGADQRPHLTPGSKLMGTGRFPEPPVPDAEYRQGYLCGMIRGDANLASYDSVRAGLTSGAVHHVHRIRTQALSSVAAIRELIRWPDIPSPSWSKGWLAGIFDAEGSYSGSLRITNTDCDVIEHTSRCLTALGFRWCLEDYNRGNGLRVVRLLGGLREVLRFFLTVDPAITRKRNIEGIAIKSDAPLHVVSVEPLGVDLPLYDITTGTGDFIADGVVSHNCFARPTHSYLDFDAGRDFETKIVVKINAAELLRRELRRASWKGELVAMGTNTDPYQRAEGHYKLMRAILTELNAARNPYSILTKGTLIQRDLDLLQAGAAVTEVNANFSVGTVDEKVWEETEPGTPHPRKRLEVVRMLNEAGIPCGVLMAPILPGISDSPEQLQATVQAAAEAGATHVTPITLHLRPGVKEEFLPWLAEHHPELVTSYGSWYRRSYAPKDVTEPIGRTVAELRRRYGVSRKRPTGGRGTPVAPEAVPPVQEGPEEDAEQMSLDLGAEPPRRAPTRTGLKGSGR